MNAIHKFLSENSISTIYVKSYFVHTVPYNFNSKYEKSKYSELRYCLSCKEKVFLIIQKMNLGIFLSKYEAENFPFINNCINNTVFNKSHFDIKYNCSIIIIDNEWDISKWDCKKMERIHSWSKFIPENIESYKHEIDIEFCEAMGIEIN